MQGPYHIAALPGDSEKQFRRSGGGGAAAAAAIEIAGDRAMQNARLRRQPAWGCGVLRRRVRGELLLASLVGLMSLLKERKRSPSHGGALAIMGVDVHGCMQVVLWCSKLLGT